MSRKGAGKENLAGATSPGETRESEANEQKPLPIILGADGKPCRACSDFKSWTKQMQGGVVGRSTPSMASAVSLPSIHREDQRKA